MSSNQVWARTAPARQRILLIVAVAAIVAAWRERSFTRNRARFGPAHAPTPST